MAWITVGSAIGIISAMMGTRNQLSRLLKDYKVYPNGKDIALQIVPMIVYVISGFFASLFILGSNLHHLLRGLRFRFMPWQFPFL